MTPTDTTPPADEDVTNAAAPTAEPIEVSTPAPATEPAAQEDALSDESTPAPEAPVPEAPAPVEVEAPAAESPAPEPAADPAPAPEVPAPAPSPEAAQAPSNGLKRILLVEDDDSLASVYVARLQAEGFDVRRVANGEEALATALTYKPDMALLDVMMPKVSGFDVLDILRNTPETANLKIIMLTALSQESDIERAKQLGVDEYLVKSQVVIADVIDRIRAHMI